MRFSIILRRGVLQNLQLVFVLALAARPGGASVRLELDDESDEFRCRFPVITVSVDHLHRFTMVALQAMGVRTRLNVVILGVIWMAGTVS